MVFLSYNKNTGGVLMRRIKKVTSIFLSVIMAFSAFLVVPLTANATECVQYDYKLLDDGTAEVTGFTFIDYDHHGGEYFCELFLNIPSEIDGYKVTSIGNWFVNNIRISSGESTANYIFLIRNVTLPEGVTRIGNGAFSNCIYIEKMIIPESVISIGDYAFVGCECLKNITIPDSVTSIGRFALGYSSSDESYDLTIAGFNGTTVEQYANENGFTFITLGKFIGDVNGDGVLSIIDATAIQKYLASSVQLIPEQLALADFNGDGVVNVNDATEIQRKLVNK